MVADYASFFQFLLYEEPLLMAFIAIILEIPRYTISTLAFIFLKIPKANLAEQQEFRISAIVPVVNCRESIGDVIASLYRQRTPLNEIIVVDNGSDDGTWEVLGSLKRRYPNLVPVRHDARLGKSGSVNFGACFATGELLLVIDDDTMLEWDAADALSSAFVDPDVGVASGNLLISNRGEGPLCEQQSLEYLMTITSGRSFLNEIDAMACCSGAFTMIRNSLFRELGGFNTGPGEDLELTLRMRRLGYKARFVAAATGYTLAVTKLRDLFRQRFRWDRDSIQIRLFAYV